jgi:hypothetical protein
VDEYQPSVEVIARIVEYKIKVWPDVEAYASSADLMDAAQMHLEKYRGKVFPLFLDNLQPWMKSYNSSGNIKTQHPSLGRGQ